MAVNDPIRTRIKIDFVALVQSLTLTHCFHWPFTEDLLLEVYRWLVVGAARYTAKHEDHRISRTTVRAALDGIMGGNAPLPESAFWAVYGQRDEHTWQEDLRHRLLRLLVAPAFAKLRAALGLEPIGPKVVTFARLDHEHVDDLKAVFAIARAGRFLNFSPNRCHPDAKLVVNVGFHPAPDGWRMAVAYSCPDGEGIWRADELRVRQQRGEPLTWFLRRARATLEAKLAPPFGECAPPDPRPWGRVRATVANTYGHLGIGTKCWDDTPEPAEDDRQSLEQMAAVAPALERLAAGATDTSEAVAALTIMKGGSNAGIAAREHLDALARGWPESPRRREEDLRRFARAWRHMTERAVTAPLFSTPGRTVVACFPSPPRDAPSHFGGFQ